MGGRCGGLLKQNFLILKSELLYWFSEQMQMRAVANNIFQNIW